MGPVQRHGRNFLFYLIAIAGGLLSLVSIIVVLELRGPAPVPDELSVVALRQSLDTAQAISRTHRTAVIPKIDTIAIRAAAADTATRARTLLRLYTAHNAAVESWGIRRNALLAAQGEAAAAAVGTWRVDSGRTGHRDREERFVELRDWYRKQAKETDEDLDLSQAHLLAAHATLMSLREARTPTDALAESKVERHLLNAELSLSLNASFDSIPAWESDTHLFDGWKLPHPIAALSDWLRTHRSLELASVIGMLGFGLLGAAVSTAVRQRRTETGEPVVLGHDITNLLLSGVSAALATYLAVKGGLAVVSSPGAEPNPYVLLLTCFVGAVYWEEAWERVRKLVSSSDEPADKGKKQDDPKPAVQVGAETQIVSDAAATTGAGAGETDKPAP